MADMDLARFKHCLAAYGTRLDLWPDAARAGAGRLRERVPEARELWNRSAALDLRLGAEAPMQPSPELMAAVLASSPSTSAKGVQGRWTLALWPFGPAWQPATGMAVAAALGIFVGLSAPADDIDLASSFSGVNDIVWEADEWETL